MSEQNENQQAAPAPDDPRSSDTTDGDAGSVRSPDAYQRAQAEKFERLSKKLEALEREKEEREQAEAQKRGDFEALLQQATSKLEKAKARAAAREAELLGEMRRSSAAVAVAKAGILDPDLATMAIRDVLAEVPDHDSEAYYLRAKTIAEKFPTSSDNTQRIVGMPPAADTTPPRENETWQERARRIAKQ